MIQIGQCRKIVVRMTKCITVMYLNVWFGIQLALPSHRCKMMYTLRVNLETNINKLQCFFSMLPRFFPLEIL